MGMCFNKHKLKRAIKKFLGINAFPTVEEYRSLGVRIGNNTEILRSMLDIPAPWLISIGDNCMITHATLLTHDASMNKDLKWVKFGQISVGNNVFIGYDAIILPKTFIGDNCVIGAGAVVSGVIPPNSVLAGNPAKIICSYEEYIKNQEKRMAETVCIPKFPRKLNPQEMELVIKTCENGHYVFMK